MAASITALSVYFVLRQNSLASEQNAWISHTHEVITKIETIMGQCLKGESTVRGYLLTDDESFLLEKRASVQRIEKEMGELAQEVADSDLQSETLKQLSGILEKRLIFSREIVALNKRKKLTEENTKRLVMKIFHRKSGFIIIHLILSFITLVHMKNLRPFCDQSQILMYFMATLLRPKCLTGIG